MGQYVTASGGPVPFDATFPGAPVGLFGDGNVSIYVLVDPRDNVVRYVGRTTDPRAREASHNNHCKGQNKRLDAWKLELRAAGLTPRFVIVDTAAPESSIAAETGWILYYRSLGDIYNGHVGAPKPRWVPGAAKITIALDREHVHEAEALVPAFDKASPFGIRHGRLDVLRAAIVKGLAVLKNETESTM